MTHRRGEMSGTVADDSEVVFEQPKKGAGVVEQESPTPSQGNEEHVAGRYRTSPERST